MKTSSRLAGPVGALLAACAPDPYSWENIVCQSEIPNTIESASLEGLRRLREYGALIRYSGETKEGVVADTFWDLTSCEVVLYANWKGILSEATVPWHELVHCEQLHLGSHYDREFPALRQDIQVLRAVGCSEDYVEKWAEFTLDHFGWLEDDDLGLLLEKCPADRNNEK